MEPQLRASIDISGSSLRFVVLEVDGDARRLHSAGMRTFDFDLVEELQRTSGHGHLDTMQDAVTDALGEHALSALSIVLHPPVSYSFKTPLPAAMSARARTKHLKQEASLLLGMMPSDDVHVDVDTLRSETGLDGESIEWLHVSAQRAPLHWRLSQMVEEVSVADFTVHASPHAVARLFRDHGEAWIGGEEPYVLLVGQYPSHVEYLLVHQGGTHHDTFSETAVAEDTAYYTALLLEQFDVEPDDVGRFFCYGHEVDAERGKLLKAVVGRSPESFNALEFLHLDTPEVDETIDPAMLVPCLGAAL